MKSILKSLLSFVHLDDLHHLLSILGLLNGLLNRLRLKNKSLLGADLGGFLSFGGLLDHFNFLGHLLLEVHKGHFLHSTGFGIKNHQPSIILIIRARIVSALAAVAALTAVSTVATLMGHGFVLIIGTAVRFMVIIIRSTVGFLVLIIGVRVVSAVSTLAALSTVRVLFKSPSIKSLEAES